MAGLLRGLVASCFTTCRVPPSVSVMLMAALRAPFDSQHDHRNKDRGDDDARNKHDQGFLHRAHDHTI